MLYVVSLKITDKEYHGGFYLDFLCANKLNLFRQAIFNECYKKLSYQRFFAVLKLMSMCKKSGFDFNYKKVLIVNYDLNVSDRLVENTWKEQTFGLFLHTLTQR